MESLVRTIVNCQTGEVSALIDFTPRGAGYGPLDGVPLVAGVLRQDPRAGRVLRFSWYGNEKVLKGIVKPRQDASLAVNDSRPELLALVAEAERMVAEAEARIEAEAAEIAPVGFFYEAGCDSSDTYQVLWPEGVDRAAVRRREGDWPAELVRKYLRHDEWARLAEELGAEHVAATLSTWGGWWFGPEGLARIFALARARLAEADDKAAAKRRGREAAEAARRARFADLECTVVRRGTSRGEEDDPYALVEVRSKETGETLRFNCRNIFDCGYVVNPAYALAPGLAPGGLRSGDDWQAFGEGKGWYPVRPLSDFERHALDYLADFPPIDTNIRM